MLYSIAPVRLRDGVSLRGARHGRARAIADAGTWHLPTGGEGRVVEIIPHQESSLPVPPTVEASLRATGRFRMLLLQPADFAGSWLPSGFTDTKIDGTTYWRGTLDGVALRIVVSCGGPPTAIGGWDMVKREAKALRWCVPAGTVYYCELETGSDAQRILQHIPRSEAWCQCTNGLWSRRYRRLACPRRRRRLMTEMPPVPPAPAHPQALIQNPLALCRDIAPPRLWEQHRCG